MRKDRKPVLIMYCINGRTGEVFPYEVNRDFSNTFPAGVLLNYLDNLVAGFKTEVEAKTWIQNHRRPQMTYRDLENAKK
jgi:hypothetical protein